jgi:Flp pilus assembly pilin Flp
MRQPVASAPGLARRLLAEEGGATMVEYGLLAALIALAVAAAVVAVSESTARRFTKIAACVAAPSVENCS